MKAFKETCPPLRSLPCWRLGNRDVPAEGGGKLLKPAAARYPEGETDPEDDDAPAEDPAEHPEVEHAT